MRKHSTCSTKTQVVNGKLNRFRKKPPQHSLDIESARAMSAETVADVLGIPVVIYGRHCELISGIRGTDKGDHVVWCDKDGTGIGDNISLVQHVSGLEFRAALLLLLGNGAAPSIPADKARQSIRRLHIPNGGSADRIAGRAYLEGRAISTSAMDAAEAQGMLCHIPGAVLYIGYEGKTPKSATRRGYLPGDPTPKRDLAGTDKAWPAILTGSQEVVWVVEGGADALALWTLLPAMPPTVIVTGGAGCKAWLEQEHVQSLLKSARLVMVALEREKNAEAQARTDALHAEQAKHIQTWCADIQFWSPPDDIKDVAELCEKGIPL